MDTYGRVAMGLARLKTRASMLDVTEGTDRARRTLRAFLTDEEVLDEYGRWSRGAQALLRDIATAALFRSVDDMNEWLSEPMRTNEEILGRFDAAQDRLLHWMLNRVFGSPPDASDIVDGPGLTNLQVAIEDLASMALVGGHDDEVAEVLGDLSPCEAGYVVFVVLTTLLERGAKDAAERVGSRLSTAITKGR